MALFRLRAAPASALLVAAGVAQGLLPHPMRDLNGAPGVYATYDWADSPPSDDMEVEHVWTKIPAAADEDGNAVFASSQFWHEAYGHGLNAAGYMGSQVQRQSNRTERRLFIFSCWDADDAHRVSWTTPQTCARFGGEGEGAHCLLDFPVREGVQYNFRIALAGANASGAFWTGTVFDTSSGTMHVVGTLFYPNVANLTGFGKLRVQSDDFLEYFGGGDCQGAAPTEVGIIGPFFHAHAVTALQAYPSYGTGDCNRSAVERCVPGAGCGRPRVLLRGGRGVARDTQDKQPLWEEAPRSAASKVASPRLQVMRATLDKQQQPNTSLNSASLASKQLVV